MQIPGSRPEAPVFEASARSPSPAPSPGAAPAAPAVASQPKPAERAPSQPVVTSDLIAERTELRKRLAGAPGEAARLEILDALALNEFSLHARKVRQSALDAPQDVALQAQLKDLPAALERLQDQLAQRGLIMRAATSIEAGHAQAQAALVQARQSDDKAPTATALEEAMLAERQKLALDAVRQSLDLEGNAHGPASAETNTTAARQTAQNKIEYADAFTLERLESRQAAQLAHAEMPQLRQAKTELANALMQPQTLEQTRTLLRKQALVLAREEAATAALRWREAQLDYGTKVNGGAGSQSVSEAYMSAAGGAMPPGVNENDLSLDLLKGHRDVNGRPLHPTAWLEDQANLVKLAGQNMHRARERVTQLQGDEHSPGDLTLMSQADARLEHARRRMEHARTELELKRNRIELNAAQAVHTWTQDQYAVWQAQTNQQAHIGTLVPPSAELAQALHRETISRQTRDGALLEMPRQQAQLDLSEIKTAHAAFPGRGATSLDEAERRLALAASAPAEAASRQLIATRFPPNRQTDPTQRLDRDKAKAFYALASDPAGDYANLRTLAQPILNRDYAERGADYQRLQSQEHLNNLIGLAVVGEGRTEGLERLEKPEQVTHFLRTQNAFSTITNVEQRSIDQVSGAIRSKVGLDAQVRVLRYVVFTEEGAFIKPLFQVKAPGVELNFDEHGRHYVLGDPATEKDDLDAFLSANTFHPTAAVIAIPRNGVPRLNERGDVDLYVGDARRESSLEVARRTVHADEAVAVAGVASTVASGGLTGIPLALSWGTMGLTAGYGLAVSTNDLNDYATHGGSAQQGVIAGMNLLAAAGGIAVLGGSLRAGQTSLKSALGSLSFATGASASTADLVQLSANWHDLSYKDRTQLALLMTVSGASATVGAHEAPHSPRRVASQADAQPSDSANPVPGRTVTFWGDARMPDLTSQQHRQAWQHQWDTQETPLAAPALQKTLSAADKAWQRWWMRAETEPVGDQPDKALAPVIPLFSGGFGANATPPALGPSLGLNGLPEISLAVSGMGEAELNRALGAGTRRPHIVNGMGLGPDGAPLKPAAGRPTANAVDQPGDANAALAARNVGSVTPSADRPSTPSKDVPVFTPKVLDERHLDALCRLDNDVFKDGLTSAEDFQTALQTGKIFGVFNEKSELIAFSAFAVLDQHPRLHMKSGDDARSGRIGYLEAMAIKEPYRGKNAQARFTTTEGVEREASISEILTEMRIEEAYKVGVDELWAVMRPENGPSYGNLVRRYGFHGVKDLPDYFGPKLSQHRIGVRRVLNEPALPPLPADASLPVFSDVEALRNATLPDAFVIYMKNDPGGHASPDLDGRAQWAYATQQGFEGTEVRRTPDSAHSIYVMRRLNQTSD